MHHQQLLPALFPSLIPQHQPQYLSPFFATQLYTLSQSLCTTNSPPSLPLSHPALLPASGDGRGAFLDIWVKHATLDALYKFAWIGHVGIAEVYRAGSDGQTKICVEGSCIVVFSLRSSAIFWNHPGSKTTCACLRLPSGMCILRHNSTSRNSYIEI